MAARLRPGDFTTSEVARILSVLNSAESAEALSERIEYENELDIGVALARRILKRRDELGGFTDLQQVDDVPLIGEERFDELARSALSLALAQERSADTQGQSQALMAEIRALRAEVRDIRAAVQAPDQIRIRAVHPERFLGQTAALVLEVVDHREQPLVDRAITVLTTWGRLRSVGGLRRQEGNCLTVRSGADGRVRVQHLPPLVEGLLNYQHDSLMAHLDPLDVTAATPAAIEPALRQLVKAYRWEANTAFRSAVDVYFRDFRPSLLDNVNANDRLSDWYCFDTTILGLLHDEADIAGAGGAVRATATARIRAKDWLGPWLALYRAALQQDNRLAVSIVDIHKWALPSRVPSIIMERASDFITREFGLVGEHATREIAGNLMRDFLISDEFSQLEQDVRVSLSKSLRAAAGAVKRSGVEVLNSVVTVPHETRVPIPGSVLDDVVLQDALRNLENGLAGKADVGTVSALDRRIDRFGDDVDDLDDRVDDFKRTLDRKADASSLAALDRRVDGHDSSLAGKADQSAVTALQGQIFKLDDEVEAMDGRLASKADISSVNALDGRLDKIDEDLVVVNGRIDGINSELVTKATVTAVNELGAEVVKLDNDVQAIDGKVTTINADVGSLNNSFTDLNNRIEPPR